MTASAPMMAARKPVILCVDDEEKPLLLRKIVLQKAGYEVLIARSGTEALQVAASHDLDLVLSDYLMPTMTGVELAAQVKAQHPSLPVLLFSGANEIPVDSEVADGFLSKIEGPDALCRRVSAFLAARNAR